MRNAMGIKDRHTDATPLGGAAPLGPIPPPGPNARSRLDQGVTVVELHGTVDLNVIAEIRVHTDAASAYRDSRVVVDLRPVEFLDCAGLGVLCRTRRRVLEREGRLALVCVRPWHLRIIKAAGLGPHFEILTTVEEALRYTTTLNDA
ncbi:STAS domain-containing protein [Streptomyces sp. NPDC006173]|uniref:STAS domain-containing protein n=1 Tax=unclassified Streptomyces TaxID=2593676 RepID=UPI0033EF5CAB